MVLTGYGFVKEVISGDTLVIIGQPKNNPPPELKLNLASLQAPRLALKPTTMSSDNVTTKDQEPFAWESRNFLRKLCIGKKVYFKVEYSVQAIGRHFGAVYILEDDGIEIFGGPASKKMSENICLTVAREGWCNVRSRDKADDSEKSVDFDELVELSELAEKAGKGIFNSAGAQKSIRTVKWDFVSSKENEESEVMKFYNKIKKEPQRALVEYIRDGASLKALLLDSMTLITFNLAGIQCPRGSKSSDGGSDSEYAQEAKFFTEVRLLNREVLLKIGGVSEKFSAFFGTVIHEGTKKNISVELIRNGLAQPVDWSMSYTSASSAASIHSAVHIARNARLRLWKNYVPPKIPGDKKYSGIVSEIISGDTILVRVGDAEDLMYSPWDCEERKIQLSSIRAPRSNRSGTDEPFAKEAKELLRTKVLGKSVDVDVEYLVGSGDQQRKYGTVIMVSQKREQNLAVLLLEAGFATLIGHKQGAERSQFYHDLIEAEGNAQEEQKGLWNPKAKKSAEDEAATKPVDVNTPALAKGNLNNLKSDNYEKRLNGVVEYVFNGARMKILVPSQNLLISFSLSGIQCSRTGGKKNDGPNMFGEEAAAFTRAVALQRNVEFIVETIDKGGNFLGTMFVKYNPKAPAQAVQITSKPEGSGSSYASKFAGGVVNTAVKGSSGKQGKQNLSILLLRHGLAKTNPIGIRFAKYAEDLLTEEREAKDAKAGLWLEYVEPVEELQDEPEADDKDVAKSSSKLMDRVEVQICHINDANDFYVHSMKEKPKLQEVEAALEKLGEKYGTEAKTTGIDINSLRKGQKVLSLFNDGSRPKWYRAEVIANHKDSDMVEVRYIDFGNSEEVAADRLREGSDDLFAIPSQAHAVSLAFVDAPGLDEDFGRDAAMYLSQLTRGKTIQALSHAKEKNGRLIVSLLPPGKSLNGAEESTEGANIITVNGLLLKEGVATMKKKVRPYLRGSAAEEEKKLMAYMQDQMKIAHQNHVNLWEYGDPREDEDDQRF